MGIIVLGFWVIIVPYLGIPASWRTVLLVLAGAAVALLGFLLRGQTFLQPSKKTEHHPFAESTGRVNDIRAVESVDTVQL